jgi:hypothetical protein
MSVFVDLSRQVKIEVHPKGGQPMLEHIYDPDPPSREMAERALRSADADTICDTLALLARPYADVHIEGEWAWLGTECLRLIKDARPSVRASAAQCLAELVRRHPAMLGGPALSAFEQLRTDPDPDVAVEAVKMIEFMRLPHLARGA